MAIGIVEKVRGHSIDIATVLVLFVFTTVMRLATALSYPLEVGIDAAYYTINVTSLLRGGYLYYDAPIIPFAIAAVLATLCGGNVVVGVKLTSAVFGGLLNVAMYFAARTFSGGDWRAGAVAGLLTAIDSSFFQMITSLVKNDVALAFLPFALAFFYRYVIKGHRRVDLLGFLATGLLVTLSHLPTAVWLFATLITFAGWEFARYLRHARWRIGIRQVLLPLALCGVAFLGVFVVLDLVIPSGNTWYTSTSLLKASQYSTSVEVLSSVASLLAFAQVAGASRPLPMVILQVLYNLTVALLVIVGVAIGAARNRSAERMVLALLFCDFILGLLLGSWLIRFQLMFFVPAYLLVSLVFLVFADKIAGWLADAMKTVNGRWFSRRRIGFALALGLTCCMVVAAMPIFQGVGAASVKPYASVQDLESIEALQGLFPDHVMLYAPQGINYFITSRTGYEAQPDWGDSNWPTYCAKKMYWDITQADRPSYYVITPDNAGFFWASKPLANEREEILSVKNFDFVDTILNVTVHTERSLYNIFCTLTYTGDSPSQVTVLLTPSGGDNWNASIDVSRLPQGLFELFIGPQPLPYPTPPPRESAIIGYVYHFASLPKPRIPLSDLIYQIAQPGAYYIFGVNITTARSLNLLNRAVEPPVAAQGSEFPALHMYLIAPFIALSFGTGDVSNFVLLLLICPLTAMYWIGITVAVVQLVRQAGARMSHRLNKAKPAGRVRVGTREPQRSGIYLHMVEPL